MPEAPEPSRERTVILEDKTLARLHGGFTQVPNFLLRRKDLTPGGKITYSLLLSYAWQDDFCFPAQQRIAQDSGYSERQVRRTLVELKSKGLIDWKQRGLNRPNIYRLLTVFKDSRTPGGGHPGPDKMSGPDRTPMSGQDRTPMSAYKDLREKTQHTRVGVSQKEGTTTPQVELVAYFHRKARHPDTQDAIPKELAQAKDLLAAHGFDACRSIVDFAIEKAAETNFKVRHFGAVLAYVPEAIAALDRTRLRKRRAEDERRRRDEETARIAAEREAYFKLPPEERLAHRLNRHVAVFKTLERREPTPAEVEDLRRRLSTEHLDA